MIASWNLEVYYLQVFWVSADNWFFFFFYGIYSRNFKFILHIFIVVGPIYNGNHVLWFMLQKQRNKPTELNKFNGSVREKWKGV